MSEFKHRNLKSLLLAATIVASPLAAMPAPASAQVSVDISVQIAPPVLPDYEQPPIPDVGYIWTPGYWYWSQDVGYYWVPGTWVLPPAANLLWTPPYWDWADGAYLFHAGYWGPHVGYYGGVDYGYGYGGEGFEGGRWNNGHFVYNRAANNFGSVHVTNIYNQKVTIVNRTKVSYAGGTGGLKTRPSTADRQAERDRHVAATPDQAKHSAAAAGNPALAAKRNNGHPPIAATARPATFEGPGVVAAHGAPRPEAAAPHAAGAAPGRPAEERPTATREEPQHPVATPGREPPAEHAAPRPGEEHPTATREEPARPATAPAHEPQGEHAAPPRPAQAEPARPPEGRPVVNREEPPRAAPAREAPAEQHAAPRPEEHAAARPPQAQEARPAEQARPAEHPAAAAPHPAPAHEAPADQGHEKKPE